MSIFHFVQFGAKCPWGILSFGAKCLLALLKIIIRIIIIMNNYDIDQTDDDNIFEDIVNVRNNNYDKLVFKSRKFTLVVMSLSFSWGSDIVVSISKSMTKPAPWTFWSSRCCWCCCCCWWHLRNGSLRPAIFEMTQLMWSSYKTCQDLAAEQCRCDRPEKRLTKQIKIQTQKNEKPLYMTSANLFHKG